VRRKPEIRVTAQASVGGPIDDSRVRACSLLNLRRPAGRMVFTPNREAGPPADSRHQPAAAVTRVRTAAVPLQALTRNHVKTLYAWVQDGNSSRNGKRPSPKTVHNVHLTLHRALEDAVDDGLIVRNPATGARCQRRWSSPRTTPTPTT